VRIRPKAYACALIATTVMTGLATSANAHAAARAATAQAGSVTALPITDFYQIVADPAQGYLFISQGSSSENHILVTNLAGQEVATIAGQDGVMGLALSADGSTLYAALSADHSVTAISTSTLQQTASYSLGDAYTPMDVALQSGKIWVSYSTGTAGSASIGDFDLSSASPSFETQAAMGGWYSAPELAADPQDSGVLVAAEPGESPAGVASFDTSVDPVTVRAEEMSFQNCDNENDLAVVPGGAEFILACGWPYAQFRYSTADLSQQGSYASSYYPSAVAIDANGDVAAGISGNSPDLYIYSQGGDTPLNTYSLSGVAARGLAWAPDGTTLFAVVGTTGGYGLQVIDYPLLTASSLSLSGPASIDVTQSVTLTGNLTTGGTAPPAGTPVTITRTVAGSTTAQTFSATTDADGNFSLTDTPPAVGQYTYTASYAGTSTFAPATASQAVDVTLVPATITLSGPSTSYLHKSLQLTGRLSFGAGTPTADTPITILRSVAGSTATQTFTVNTDANGDFSLTDTPPATGEYTYTASYAGSATTATATSSRSVDVTLPPVALSLTVGPSTVNYESTIHLAAYLGATHQNRTISIYAQTLGSTSRTLLRTGTVNSHGELTATYKAAHSTTFSVVFAGDAEYAARTVTSTVYVRAAVSESISGYYGSRLVHGVTYRLYHRKGKLRVAATVSPNKRGECVAFQVQEYYQGAWRNNVVTACVVLNSASKGGGYFTLTQADIGYHYRVRAGYFRSSTDTSNLDNVSAWQYLIVEK